MSFVPYYSSSCSGPEAIISALFERSPLSPRSKPTFMRKNLPSPFVSFTFRSFYFRVCFLVFLFPMFNCFPSYSQARLLKDLATEPAYYNEHHNLIAAGDAMYFSHNGG